jgi:hypothetical protein
MRNAVRNLCSTFVNDVDAFPFFRDAMLPRLERMGLRAKPASR